MGASQTLGAGVAVAGDASLRRRVASAAAALEKLYGHEERGADEDILDSLIGCVLSQNTTDVNSGRAWETLKKLYPTWQGVARAKAHSIEAAIRVAGLAPTRSRRIKDILAQVKKTSGGYDLEFLREASDDEAMEYLASLDGVGKKTAAVVLLFAMGRDVFPVDTHVHRISQRLGFVREGVSRDECYEEMKKLVAPGKALSFHLNLIRFGKERCHKRRPECGGCVFRARCVYVGRRVND